MWKLASKHKTNVYFHRVFQAERGLIAGGRGGREVIWDTHPPRILKLFPLGKKKLLNRGPTKPTQNGLGPSPTKGRTRTKKNPDPPSSHLCTFGTNGATSDVSIKLGIMDITRSSTIGRGHGAILPQLEGGFTAEARPLRLKS